jgi:hypothetical protein
MRIQFSKNERLERRDIAEDRVARFDAYRDTLELEERAELDCWLEELTQFFRRRSSHPFGTRMAKELVMALIEHADQHAIREEPTP